MIITNDYLNSEICKRSFFHFVKEFWSVIIPDEPIYNWHIPYLCNELQTTVQTVIDDKPKQHDLIVNICPGTTKSTLVSIMLPVWVWVMKPDAVILCNTISNTNATKFAQKRRDIVLSEKFKRYFPKVELRRDSTALSYIKNTQGGEINQYTTKGRITGDHGHIRIDDDPMSYTDAISDAQAEKCIDGFKSFATRNKSLEKTVYIQVMQRLSAIDTTAHAIRVMDNYKHIVLPAILNDNVQPPELKDRYIDGLLDPIRLSRENLNSIKKGLSDDDDSPMSDSAFDAQYLQDVENKAGLMYSGELQFEDFKKVPFKDSVSYSAVDPADDGDDYFGQIFAYQIGSKFYVKDVIYNRNDTEYNLPTSRDKIDFHNVLRTYVEKNGIGSVYGKMLAKEVSGVKLFSNTEPKLERISAFAWIVKEHFVFDSSNKDEEYSTFIKHLQKLPRSGNKQMVGAADVVTHLGKVLFLRGYFKS